MNLDIENKLPQSCNMRIKDFWKQKVMETLSTIYGDGLKIDKVDQYLDAIIAKSHNPIAQMRNIYTEKNWEVELNDIPKMIYENNLICGANGTYTVQQQVKFSELSELLIQWLEQRSKLKKIAIECDEKGDVAGARKYDNLQNSRKENNNSAYGVSAMNGYILFSPDSASMITSQGRELISEMMWTLEKFLGKNMTFKTMNEFYSYINEITRIELDQDLINKYQIKVPTFEMITKRLKDLLSDIPEEEKEGIDNNKSLFLMAKNIDRDPIKSINFYYRYNLYEFLIHNPKVMDIINWIMKQGKTFKSPIPKIMETNESKIYIEPINELVDIFLHFVVFISPTYDRVNKYLTRKRREIVLSDTDSVITRMDEWINFVNKHGEVKFDTFYDDDAVYRAANIMSYICTDVCNVMGRNMARNCYVPKMYRERINLKNEFFFKSLVIYPNIKKNYSAWTTLREGVSVNKVANTGLSLEGSNINPFVKKELNKIIFEEIHSVKDISITRVMKRVYDLEEEIRRRLVHEQDVTLGTHSSYKNNYKANPWSDTRIRAVALWNHLYPDDLIEPCNKIYVLNTVLEKEEQINLIQDIRMREVVRDKIFRNPVDPKAAKYGLRTIAIPDRLQKFPRWLKDIVDVNKLSEKHVNSITSLLPSLGVYCNRIKSNRNHMSPLINL